MQQVVIDGHPYEVALGGLSKPLRAKAGGEEVMLPVWTWADHRNALRDHLKVQGNRLVFDDEGYAEDVLKHAGLDQARWPALVPLALWWAAGAGGPPRKRPTKADLDTWIPLEVGLRARVRAWTWQERLSVMRECVEDGDEGQLVDPLAVIERLLATNLVALEHPSTGPVEDLDGLGVAVVHELLAVLVDLSLPTSNADTKALLDDPALARQILNICRALGWTPSQVLHAPATEIDMLRALLGQTPSAPRSEPSTPQGPRRSGLHAHPDAVVLNFGTEAET